MKEKPRLDETLPAWKKPFAKPPSVLLGALCGLCAVDQIINIGRIRTLGANLGHQHVDHASFLCVKFRVVRGGLRLPSFLV